MPKIADLAPLRVMRAPRALTPDTAQAPALAVATRFGRRAALAAACVLVAGCSSMGGQSTSGGQSGSGVILSDRGAAQPGQFGGPPPATPNPVAQAPMAPLPAPEPFPDSAASQFPGAYAGGVAPAAPVPSAPVQSAPIYTAPSQAAPAGGAVRHRVVQGDTVFSLARRYGSQKEAIRDANGLDFAYSIRVGQDLVIPLGLAAATPGFAAAPTNFANVSTASTPIAYRAPLTQPRPMMRPIAGGQIIRSFGSDFAGAPSDGVGLAAPAGTPVLAADDGRVAFISQPAGGVGSVVIVEHPGQIVTVYGRVTNIVVRPGQLVSRGAPLAVIAQPPSGAPYVHFELRREGRAINPTPFL